MGWNDHVDWELDAQIQDLVDCGILDVDTAAYGIARQVVDRGLDSLSNAQRQVWNHRVWIPLSDRLKALEVQRIIDSNPE
jgi:hypothetical protein